MKLRSFITSFKSSNIFRRNFTFRSEVTIDDLKEMTPHDAEKELMKLNKQINKYFKAYKFEEAVSLSLDYSEKVSGLMGKDNVVYASAVNNYAYSLKMTGKRDEAIGNYTHALQLYEDVVGKNHPSYAKTLANIGVVFVELARNSKGMNKLDLIDRAEEAFKDSFEIRQEIGASASDMISIRTHIASVHTLRGNYADSYTYLKDILDYSVTMLGEDDVQTSVVLNNLGYVCKLQKNYNESEEYYTQSLAIRQKVYGNHHVETIMCMNNLAELYIDAGREEESHGIQEKIIKLVEEKEEMDTNQASTTLEKIRNKDKENNK